MPDNGVYRSLVFDFDGTLAALTLDFEAMRRKVASVASFFLGPQAQPKGYMLEWVEEQALALGRRGEERVAAAFTAQAHACIEEEEMRAATQSGLFPFARELLLGLGAGGVRTAVITRNTSRAVLHVFPDILEHCDCLLARDHVRRIKPHPEHLLLALRGIDGCKRSALMVGDHPLDITTGLEAGTHTAGVTSGRMTAADFHAARAHHIAKDCLELVRGLTEQGLLPFRTWPPMS